MFNSLYPTAKEVFRKISVRPTKHWGAHLYSGENFAILSSEKCTRFEFTPTKEDKQLRAHICKGLKRYRKSGGFKLSFWKDYEALDLVEYGGYTYSADTLARLAPLFDKGCVLTSGELLLVGRKFTGLLQPV